MLKINFFTSRQVGNLSSNLGTSAVQMLPKLMDSQRSFPRNETMFCWPLAGRTKDMRHSNAVGPQLCTFDKVPTSCYFQNTFFYDYTYYMERDSMVNFTLVMILGISKYFSLTSWLDCSFNFSKFYPFSVAVNFHIFLTTVSHIIAVLNQTLIIITLLVYKA